MGNAGVKLVAATASVLLFALGAIVLFVCGKPAAPRNTSASPIRDARTAPRAEVKSPLARPNTSSTSGSPDARMSHSTKDSDNAAGGTTLEELIGGDDTGSWNPVGDYAGEWGRAGQTALGCLCLEVYYRYAVVQEP